VFTLRREGTFDALLTGDFHCGLTKGFNRFKYEVEICVTSDGLDPKGFVVDNREIQQYFDTYYGSTPTTRSCETMASTATFAFLNLLGTRSKHCRRVCVRIYGLPTAYVEYVFQKSSRN
jgi:hypothetical protein